MVILIQCVESLMDESRNEPEQTQTRVEDSIDLVDWIRDRSTHSDLLELIRLGYNQDLTLKKVKEAPTQFKNFELRDGLLYLKNNRYKLLCIPVNSIINGRTLREVFISEAHSLLAHLSSVKTLAYLQDHVWWKIMSEDVRKFCKTCTTCKRCKPNNQKPYGLLNPLDIPIDAWDWFCWPTARKFRPKWHL